MGPQRIITNKALVLLALCLGFSACTLRKRDKPQASDPKAKIAMETAQPKASGLPAAGGEGQTPFAGIPGKIDPQVQIDFEEYNNPTLSDEDEYNSTPDGRPTGKKRFTGHTNDSDYAYTDSSADFLVPYIRTVQEGSLEGHEQTLSADFAKRIRSVKLVKTTGPEIAVQVRYEIGQNRTSTVELVGPARMGGRYAELQEKHRGSKTISGDRSHTSSKKRTPIKVPIRRGVQEDEFEQSATNDLTAPTEEPTVLPSPSPSPEQRPLPVQAPPQSPKQQPKPQESLRPKPQPRRAVVRRSSSENRISGEMRCMDLVYRSRCSTYLLKLVWEKKQGEATAEIVIRRSPVSLKITPPRSQSRDPRIRILKEVFYNSSQRNPEGHHFVTLEMYSFAVVNGRSEFQIRMMTNQGEYLYFSGPLLTAFGSEPTDLLLKRNPEYSDASATAWRRQGGGFLTGMIDAARLVFNNGRGGLMINLVLSDNQTQDPVNFGLTFNRNAPPILDLTQDSIYFTP